MKKQYLFILSFITFTVLAFSVRAQMVDRFEHLDASDGLTQNNVLSMYCDSKGYMWFGTMNGLNRYDGNQFKVYKVDPLKKNSLTHNRIIEIREDAHQFLWVKTYDGYMHYYIPNTEEFITLPDYLQSTEEKNSIISCFSQVSEDEIWLGSTNSGAYHLVYDSVTARYDVHKYINRGEAALSNNSVTFIEADHAENVWIGTQKGLDQYKDDNGNPNNARINHYFAEYHFTCGVVINENMYFGTDRGLIMYNSQKQHFRENPFRYDFLIDAPITLLQATSDNRLIIGTRDYGVVFIDLEANETSVRLLKDKQVKKIYEDRFGNFWVNTNEFGIYQIKNGLNEYQHYALSRPDQTVVDEERQFIFEDSRHNLWIGLHGGLAWYDRAEDEFDFYYNDPLNPNSISSNIVYCITEDKSGLIWVGTGQPKGGVDKIITVNPAFRHIMPHEKFIDNTEYVFRALYQDSNGMVWAATKSGKIYLLHPEKLESGSAEMSRSKILDLGSNIYAILEDENGFIWLGSKGEGLFVSERSVSEVENNYDQLNFINYRFQPDDSTSLSSDNIYSIYQDNRKQIWIGTYGGGLNLVNREQSNLSFQRFNTINSEISSNDVRQVLEDSKGRLWVATAFGLNMILQNDTDDLIFRKFFYDPENPYSLSYNDVIHLFEDSRQQLWFATFGGGLNTLSYLDDDSIAFQRYSQDDGLVNDAVYALLEDSVGDLWISTEKGISRMDKTNHAFENFDRNNGLQYDNFCENTGCLFQDKMIFGGTRGVLVINPQDLKKSSFKPNVVLTNFQIFNKDVDFTQSDAPFSQPIETLDEITLRHFQSSFSIEYTALSYFAPNRNSYSFKLENFDQNWNEVGNQRKATYTNLPPGKYVFRVKAANWDGTMNEIPRSIGVTIVPPWWATRLAYILYLISVAGLLFLILRWYSRYHKLQNDLKVEKRVSEIKLRFFTNISHEIRTPLTLILGPIDDIKAFSQLPSGVTEKIQIMERNGKRMLRLVNQLLDFRKIQKKKMKLTVREIDLNAFVKDILENFIPLAQHKNVKVKFNADTSSNLIWVDPKKFDSVIFNLMSNAFKFSSSGKSINVTIKPIDETYTEVRVKDEGPGIPEDKKPHLFQRFSVLSDTKEEMNNSGIGLSLAYEIMKLHKGDILVESEPGKGSCFIVRLMNGNTHFSKKHVDVITQPDQEISHQEVLVDSVPVEEETAQLKGKKNEILIVEDNPEIIDYLKASLNHLYSLQTAVNGREALEKLNNNHPDLIISDIMMPVMDGIEMTRRIKEDMAVSHIPVVMLTAKSNMEDQIMGVESGAEAYILKPFNARYLKAVIKNLIHQRVLITDKLIFHKGPGVEPGKIQITTKDEQFLEDVMKLIQEHYMDPEFNVESLVEKSYLSRTVFYNKLKGLTGLSPVEFLRQARLKIACQLLRESDYNISEVAIMTGFNSIKYFRQHFKMIFGCTPNEYRAVSIKNDNQSEEVIPQTKEE